MHCYCKFRKKNSIFNVVSGAVMKKNNNLYKIQNKNLIELKNTCLVNNNEHLKTENKCIIKNVY